LPSQRAGMATTMKAAMSCTRGLTQQRPAARSRSLRMVPHAVAAGQPKPETGGNPEGIWLPGIEAPKRLEGLVGNRGFDPLNFAVEVEDGDTDRLDWFVEAEKTNGRWAMAACAGIMGQELLGVTPAWFDAGAKTYWMPDNALTALEFLIVGHFELKRYEGYKKYKTSGFLNSFPFDPLGQNSRDMQLKEIKNSRLAMVAFIGFAVQAIVTHEQPIEGLKKHLSDPFGHNIISNIGNLPAFIGNVSAPVS